MVKSIDVESKCLGFGISWPDDEGVHSPLSLLCSLTLFDGKESTCQSGDCRYERLAIRKVGGEDHLERAASDILAKNPMDRRT